MTRSLFEHIESLVGISVHVPGDFAELGVFHGVTFAGIRHSAAGAGKLAWAIDSWQGMPKSSERDLDDLGRRQCTRGSLDPGGDTAINEILDAAKRDGDFDAIRIVKGWVPEVLDTLPQDLRFAFVHLDLDQYDSTLAALRWIWPRLNCGGILACHDWFPHRTTLAAGAIRQWSDEMSLPVAWLPKGNHGWFVRHKDHAKPTHRRRK